MAPQRTLKGVYIWAQTYYYRWLDLPSYQSWVRKCHQALPQMFLFLGQLLDKEAPILFMGSTMLEVCKLVRADRHKVAHGVADFGRNWQGWHFGFKLHASCSLTGHLCAIWFTPANESDSQQVPHLVNDATMVGVGDGGYTASKMRERMWREHKAFILSPPHPSQKKKVLAQWQYLLLRKRP
ncbi:MAG TPA: transposase [Candidatus Saccharimonadia bacterium]|nr:transposase [Candidatus Saccharimonadia bacterium]